MLQRRSRSGINTTDIRIVVSTPSSCDPEVVVVQQLQRHPYPRRRVTKKKSVHPRIPFNASYGQDIVIPSIVVAFVVFMLDHDEVVVP